MRPNDMKPSEMEPTDDDIDIWELTLAQLAREEADAKEGEDWLEYCRRWPGGVASGEGIPESVEIAHDDDIPW